MALSVLCSCLAPTLGASSAAAAPQDTIDAKRVEAQRIQNEMDANGERISILDEQYNETRIKIQEAEEGITAAETQFAKAAKESGRLSRQLQSRAAALYVQASSGSPLEMFDAANVRDLGSRTKYTAAAADQDQALLEQLKGAKQRLKEQRSELESKRKTAQAEEDALAEQRDELEAAQAKQQKLLNSVKGDIARLVHQEEVRREREARARAQEAQRQAAAELAARRATENDNNSNGGRGTTITDPDTGVGVDVPAPNPNAQTAINTARAQLGKPYVYAAAGPNSFDCSGLTMYAWASAGVSLPHSSAAQYASLPHVPQSELQPGDLVFFGSPIHHVGLYVGGGTMIEAPHTGAVVRYGSIGRHDYIGASRPG